MNKQTFIEYISESNFQELFIREMGWNNPKGQSWFDLTIEGETYHFTQVAERNGFQVLTCVLDEIPSSSQCKKIDTRLRRQANDYICIFCQPHSQHHLWAVPVKKVEKRDLVMVEYENADRAGFLFEKMDGLTFELDEVTTIMDVKERIQGEFVINSEKITKDFYTGFRKEHIKFAKFIKGIDDELEVRNNRNKQWYASVMLNRLMFCYFIQKKGFLDNNTNYLRDKLEMVKQEEGTGQFFSFYRRFLIILFHDGLNTPRHEPDFIHRYGRIPYLNGGMFDIHELEKRYVEIDINDEAFESLFAFFDQWHWHLDDRLTASGKDINPDVLGYIFEQYINDRAQMGAYYTKEDITEYIGRNTIIPYLMDAVKRTDERPFKEDGEVWRFLRESGDRYIFDAVRKGHDIPIPEHIAIGIDTTKPNLLERRSRWNERTPEEWALPTEIWRETVERLQRYTSIKKMIEKGEIHEINDFITYNLDIRQFVQDFLAKTNDHLFVKHFYHELQKVTILDPTCGSGAFLFAALNILEPLYETCIARMQDWAEKNSNLFKEELQELNVKYRNNIRYFIYKNIILRNLYGVDIMAEATEIAKLRLFLKMVAVVDVNPRDPNLGLEPLPDIDFNIRCGNTLVGYANERELKNGLVMDLFAQQEFMQKVNDEMVTVSLAYNVFKQVQLSQGTNLEIYKKAKAELKKRLSSLNKNLNLNLYTASTSGIDYDKWEKSHQPFHWLAEYYDIIQGNGGFDVVIGNPPYVEYHKKVHGVAVSDIYQLHGYKTITCGNLYAFIIERCSFIIKEKGKTGMIIPHSSICTDRMKSLYMLFKKRKGWFSTYDTRPSTLFDGVDQRLLIYLLGANYTFTTRYYHWNTEFRPFLLNTLNYINGIFFNDYVSLSKISNEQELSILNKLISNTKLHLLYRKNCEHKIFYHGAPRYFTRATRFAPYFYNDKDGEKLSVSVRSVSFDNNNKANIASCLISSSLFYFWFVVTSDCRHLNAREVDNYPYSYNDDEKYNMIINQLCTHLMDDFQRNKYRKHTYYKATGQVIYDEFYPKLSKPIIDEIDAVLAKHYGFTEEELDFIINYDIKYRMGDELNENI